MSHKVRNLEPRDLPALWKMAAAQNRRDGTSYPFPRVFQMDKEHPGFGNLVQNVPLALVTERDGRVRGGYVFLRTIEIMGWTAGREDMEFGALHIPMALDLLKRKGYDDAHTFIPKIRLTRQHAKLLEDFGMTRVDQRLATFYRET